MYARHSRAGMVLFLSNIKSKTYKNIEATKKQTFRGSCLLTKNTARINKTYEVTINFLIAEVYFFKHLRSSILTFCYQSSLQGEADSLLWKTLIPIFLFYHISRMFKNSDFTLTKIHVYEGPDRFLTLRLQP